MKINHSQLKKTILVVAAHPDDEVLGCGGTISELSKKNTVHTLFMTNGISARNYKNDKIKNDEIKKRRKAAEKSCKILGSEVPIFLDFPDNAMDTFSILEITKKIENVFRKINPEIVFTHKNSDLNIDHQLTNRAVMTAARPLKKSSIKQVLFFEILSSSEWNFTGNNNLNHDLNWFEDISETIKTKIRAIKVYDSELKKWPHPRSIEGITTLAKNRGSTVGYYYAESFTLGYKR